MSLKFLVKYSLAYSEVLIAKLFGIKLRNASAILCKSPTRIQRYYVTYIRTTILPHSRLQAHSAGERYVPVRILPKGPIVI